MGNKSSNASSPAVRSSYPTRRSSPQRRFKVEAVAAPREFVEQRSSSFRQRKSSPRRSSPVRAALPRDPTTGRYLPRGQRAAAPSRAATAQSRASSPRRRVSVEVFNSEPRRAASPRVRSPRKQREPQNAAPQPRVSFNSRVPTAPTAVPRSEMESTSRGSPILRSSYTRCEAGPEEQEQVAVAPRRQRSPPVSRREYATPSLAAATQQQIEKLAESDVVIGPSTTRQMKRMSVEQPAAPTTLAPAAPQRLSTTVIKPANPSELLFSYLNAA